ncbi:hypothetical protein [Pseudomonas chlororaphis]|uniref:hypothetical protein n=1 Tax=Pseudomonas chlororaphis TaxID=587753 RepID=UPI000F56BBE9|nr:hypothetical protein [Pseudomonas chlororaphis]
MKIQRRPNSQPLSMLMVVADVVAGQLTTLVDQRKALLEAKARPGSMDAGTINHVLRVFSETKELMLFYDQQIAHWREKCSPSTTQLHEIDRLESQVASSNAAVVDILTLARKIQARI